MTESMTGTLATSSRHLQSRTKRRCTAQSLHPCDAVRVATQKLRPQLCWCSTPAEASLHRSKPLPVQISYSHARDKKTPGFQEAQGGLEHTQGAALRSGSFLPPLPPRPPTRSRARHASPIATIHLATLVLASPITPMQGSFGRGRIQKEDGGKCAQISQSAEGRFRESGKSRRSCSRRACIAPRS
jgi:hypothetical protein